MLSMATNRANVGGWLQGKTVRKGGALASNSHTRSSTPQTQSTPIPVFGGGVKDASGRTTEYSVSREGPWSLLTIEPSF